jgi:transposase
MKKQRRQFNKEFKIMAVELCRLGKPKGEVAEELGLRTELVSRWKREYDQRKGDSFSGQGKPSLTAEQTEIAKLKKQLREAEIKRDITEPMLTT